MGRWRLKLAAVASAIGFVALVQGGCEKAPAPEREAVVIAPSPMCDCKLSSWIVVGRGRHLYLEIDCPDGFDELDGRVEFTDETLHGDYVERRDESGALVAPRVARLGRDWVLRPFVDDPDERVEATWRITVAQARVLQRDRIWESPYVIVGTNSNSGMAAVLREAGLVAPARVLEGGGVFGEFPGINLPLGPLAEPE